MKRKYFNVIFAILVLLSMLLLSDKSVEVMKRIFQPVDTKSEKGTIVIDPGHGGFDPGKVGVNGALEKDINLSISKKLQELLIAEGYDVVMTRETDEALCSETDSNKKSTDMKNRVKLLEETKPLLAISIHQNSFTQESSRGAQVFYYSGSIEGEKFAKIMQQTIKESIADGNHRIEKPNTAYYLLKKTTCPLVIVECGFLSNHAEASLLVTQEYQEKMASAIKDGIIKYLASEEGSNENNNTESNIN